MKTKYILVIGEQSVREGGRISYGIAMAEETENETKVVRAFEDMTTDIGKMERLVDLCNKLELDPDHLDDVVDDFIYEDRMAE